MSKSFNRAEKRDVYSFTTSFDDAYLDRVIEEAQPSTNFILIHDEDKETGEHGVVVLVRSNILNIVDSFPALKLGPVPLFVLLDSALEAGKEFVFVAGAIPGDESGRLLERLRHDIRRIKNVLEGRVIKVQVESF